MAGVVHAAAIGVLDMVGPHRLVAHVRASAELGGSGVPGLAQSHSRKNLGGATRRLLVRMILDG